MVIGTFRADVDDTPLDTGSDPDVVDLQGTVTFTPSVPVVKVAAAVPRPVTLFLRPRVVTLEAGRIHHNNDYFIKLEASNDGAMNPTEFTWKVDFDLQLDGQRVPMTSFNIRVPASGVVDLTLASPVAVSNGVQSLVGPPGQSAYALAVSQGFIGTEAAWLESLRGADGATTGGSALPSGGTAGQILTKTSTGYAWVTPSAGVSGVSASEFETYKSQVSTSLGARVTNEVFSAYQVGVSNSLKNKASVDAVWYLEEVAPGAFLPKTKG
jgi:hypothetical protein